MKPVAWAAGIMTAAASRLEDEHGVAELVPEVSALADFVVGALEEALVDQCPEHIEMRGWRLVEAGEQRVDDPQARPRRDDQSRPPTRCVHVPAIVGRGLEGADDARPAGDPAPGRLYAAWRAGGGPD